MNSFVRVFVLLFFVGLFLGCGPGSTPVPEQTTPPTDLIRRDLQHIVDSGIVGSEMLTIEENINTLAETEPDKAAELKTELESLKGARGAQATQQAKKMIDML